MKLHNRIMSWLLSPGAYAAWHAMSNPEEWIWDEENDTIDHKTGVFFWVKRWWNIAPAPLMWIPPFCFFTVPMMWALWPVFLDAYGEYRGAIGYFERHLIAGRAARLRDKLRKKNNVRRKRNQAVFTKLTVNQE